MVTTVPTVRPPLPTQAAMPRQTLADRFWAKVTKTDRCWLWTGARTVFGHGVIGRGGRGSGTERAHRLSWTLHFGPIPPGMRVCHKCDNPPCVKPDHLFLGTDLDNMRDAIKKGRFVGYPVLVGERNPNAKLTAAQVKEIRLRYATACLPKRKGRRALQEELAREFRVDSTQIRNVLAGRAWKGVMPNVPAAA